MAKFLITSLNAELPKYISITGNFKFRIKNTGIKNQKEKRQNYRKRRLHISVPLCKRRLMRTSDENRRIRKGR